MLANVARTIHPFKAFLHCQNSMEGASVHQKPGPRHSAVEYQSSVFYMNSAIEVNEFIHSSEASKMWAMVCTLCKNICKDLQYSHTQIRLYLANFTSYTSCTVTSFQELTQASIPKKAVLDTWALKASKVCPHNTTIKLVLINTSGVWAAIGMLTDLPYLYMLCLLIYLGSLIHVSQVLEQSQQHLHIHQKWESPFRMELALCLHLQLPL